MSNAQTAVDYYLDGTLVATDQQSAESGSRILQVPVSSSIGLHLIQRITQGSPVGSDDCREIDFRVVPLGFLGPWSDDPHMTPRTITLHDKPVLLAKFIPLDADCYLPECEKVVFVQVVRQYWVDTSANLHDWPTDWPVGLPNKRETAAIAPDRISSGPDAGFRIDINSVAESDPYYNGDDVSDHAREDLRGVLGEWIQGSNIMFGPPESFADTLAAGWVHDQPGVNHNYLRPLASQYAGVIFEYHLGVFCAAGPGRGLWLGWGQWVWTSMDGKSIQLNSLPSSWEQCIDCDNTEQPSVFSDALQTWIANTNTIVKTARAGFALPQPITTPPYSEGRNGRSCRVRPE